jgi:outer membrane lipoprotein-sorting protein
MTSWMRRAVVVALGLAFSATVLAEDLESVTKRLGTAWGKHKSVTAKMTMTNHMEMGDMKVDGKGDGTYEVQHDGDKIKVHMEMKGASVRKTGEKEDKFEQATTVVVDGEFAYTLSDMMGQKMAVKTKPDPLMSGDPKALLEQLGKDNALKLLPDETVDGHKAFVIQATPKEAATSMPSMNTKVVVYFDQENGVVLKVVAGTDDKMANTTTYTDYKFDTDIAPDHFKFKAPEGVEVMDQTVTPKPG